jgi:hypothetical protein
MKIYNVVQEDYSGDVSSEGVPILVQSFLNRKDAEKFLLKVMDEAISEVHNGLDAETLREKNLLEDEEGIFWSLWKNESKRDSRATIYETYLLESEVA